MDKNIDFMMNRFNDLVWYILDNRDLLLELKPLIVATLLVASVTLVISVVSIVNQRKIKKQLRRLLEQKETNEADKPQE